MAPAVLADGPASVADESVERSREEWLERVEEARRRYEAFAAQAGAGLASSFDDDARETERSDAHLHDGAMRAGDVVATRDGLLIFKGSKDFPYAADDFERLDEKLATTTPHARALLEMLRAGAIRRR